MKRSIGGFSGLEICQIAESPLTNYYGVNSCRNALVLLLKERRINEILMPYYGCEASVKALISNGIKVIYYHLNKELEIRSLNNLDSNTTILYINYFGVKNEYVKWLATKVENLVIDNAQAFYSADIEGVDGVYSPRKFFGVPDGGLLRCDLKIDLSNYPKDYSAKRCLHLLKRLELEPEKAYSDFLRNEKVIENLPIRRMSMLTKNILEQTPFEKVKLIRNDNFQYLAKELIKINELHLRSEEVDGPLVYPLLIPKGKLLRERMIASRIYIAKYWDISYTGLGVDAIETYFADNIVALPIDQRYTKDDMDIILNQIKKTI